MHYYIPKVSSWIGCVQQGSMKEGRLTHHPQSPQKLRLTGFPLLVSLSMYTFGVPWMVTSFIGTGRLMENLFAWLARVRPSHGLSRAYNPPEDTRQLWQWHLTQISGIFGNSMLIAPQLHVPLIGAILVEFESQNKIEM